MIGAKYACDSCTNTLCWLCKGNAYYDKVMSMNTEQAKDHRQDIVLFRDFVKLNGCASNSLLTKQRADMVALLRAMEWTGAHTDYEDSWAVMTVACPFCFNAKVDGHKPSCNLIAMIKELQ